MSLRGRANSSGLYRGFAKRNDRISSLQAALREAKGKCADAASRAWCPRWWCRTTVGLRAGRGRHSPSVPAPAHSEVAAMLGSVLAPLESHEIALQACNPFPHRHPAAPLNPRTESRVPSASVRYRQAHCLGLKLEESLSLVYGGRRSRRPPHLCERRGCQDFGLLALRDLGEIQASSEFRGDLIEFCWRDLEVAVGLLETKRSLAGLRGCELEVGSTRFLARSLLSTGAMVASSATGRLRYRPGYLKALAWLGRAMQCPQLRGGRLQRSFHNLAR